MKLSIHPLLSAFAIGLMICSCNGIGKDFDETKTVTISVPGKDAFAAVGTLPSNDETAEPIWTTFDGPTCAMVFDFNDNTCELTCVGLRYGADEIITFTTKPLKQSKEKDANVRGVDYEGPIAVLDGNGQAHTLTNIRIFVLLDANRTYGGAIKNAVHLSFVIDGKYLIQILPYENHFYGATVSNVIGEDDATPYRTTNAIYQIAVSKDRRKADISIYQARFAVSMPPQNIDFKNVSLSFTPDGMKLKSVTLIPEIDNKENTQLTITDLEAEVVYEKTLDMKFRCAARWDVDFSGTVAYQR